MTTRKPIEWEIITDPCPSVNPETGGLCSQRLGTHRGRHYHSTWEWCEETGEMEISGCTEWDDPS